MLSNKTPKLDRSDGVKEMKEKAPKRKLPFTAGANGDQKDSDSGRRFLLSLRAFDLHTHVDFQVEIKRGKKCVSDGLLHHVVLMGSSSALRKEVGSWEEKSAPCPPSSVV